MTSHDPKSIPLCVRRFRKLFFDVLEDRRLLAGLDVFVFDDSDGSRDYDSNRDGSLSNRAVYIDLNNDAKHSSAEPWAISNGQGLATFSNLDPGTYSVRLLGTNKSVQQTFPTLPASQGVWADGLGISKVIRVESSGLAWGISDNSLSLVNTSANQTIKTIRFGTSKVIDAVLKPANESDLTGYVLTQNQDSLQMLWYVSTAGNGTKRAINLDVRNATQLVSVGEQVMVVHGIHSKEISSFDFTTGIGGVLLGSTGVTGLPTNALVKPIGGNGFLILANADSDGGNVSDGNTSSLALYEFSTGTARVVGKRTFVGKVTALEGSHDGTSIAVATNDGFVVLRSESGLPTANTLAGAIAPVVFDSAHNLLFTGSSSSTSKLIGWSTVNWTEELSIPVSGGRAIVGTSSTLSLDASGIQLIAIQNESLYQHSVAVAAATKVTISSVDQKQIQIGVRSVGENLKPVLSKLDTIDVDEDGQLKFDSSKIRAKTTDPDGDSVVFVVRSGPSNGEINWNQDATGTYQPSANLNGQDAITIQAYDGRDWSVLQNLAIEIRAVNDLPTEIVFSDEIVPENPELQSALSKFYVLDVDADANYEFSVDDVRFGIIDGVLRLIKGSVNFEEEPLIVLAVTGFDRLRPQDSISRKVTLRIQDVNDAPTGISAPGRILVPELTQDLRLAQLAVIDQDVRDVYEWSVSDNRFTVNSGELKLATGVSLDFESEPSIVLIVKAKDHLGEFAIEKSITIMVVDQNDEPTGIVIDGSATIRENELGVAVGRVSVLDPDQGEQYSFSVNDSRFEVVSGGMIRLRPGASVGYVEPGFIDLTIFASSLRSGNRASGSLRVFIEKDPTPHHNDKNPYDVDGDGVLTPLDPLIIINHINNNGSGPIQEPGEGEGSLPDLDVDGDGQVTPIDILILINKRNQQSDEELNYYFGKKLGEGEGPAVGQPSVSSLLPVPMMKTVAQSTNNLNDSSLASYLADITEDAGPRRLRRR